MTLVRDPFERPVVMRAEDGSGIDRALRACLPPELHDDAAGPVLVSFPTTSPASVIGATVGPPCAKCGRRVWLAPSSQRAKFRAVVCAPCVVAALERFQGRA